MGLSPFKNCSTYAPTAQVLAPNPNPARFEVLEVVQVGHHTVARIRYPDCTNYEGVKICLFANTAPTTVKSRQRIDPHFDKGNLSPFARFTPTTKGWEAAVLLAENLYV